MAAGDSNKPCFAFGRGECKFGDRCRYSHKSQLTSKITSKIPSIEPCRYLNTSKGCSRGSLCEYSHENMTSKRDAHAQQPQPTAKLRPQTEFETAYRDWTFLIPRQNSRFHIVETWKLFKAGWDLMSKDHTEIRQHIIKKLASEEGLATIKALVDGMVGRIELQSRLHMFKDETLPFFRIISHPDVLSSFILETPLDTIYTFLFGPNSRRALEVFKASTSSLATLAWEDTAMDETLPSAAVTATLAVLEKIVDLNQGAQVIAEFTSIVDELSTCIPEQLLEAGSRSLNKIRQRLGIETAMPISKGRRSTNPKGFRPKFELGQDLPGVLSEHGPRHDNDHENIFDIKILPTTEEIQSMRSEYLPSCDSSKHHLPGVAGLLDRQFRLLREDTVGQLRDAVQIEYKRLNNPPQSRPPPQKHSNGIRNIVYHDVALVRLEFDRKKGLQIVADFDQPSALKKKGSKEREEWWKNSKLLQTDAFVCLVCFTGRAIFFRVCDPTPTPALKRRDVENVGAHSNENWRSVKGRPSLFRQAQRATLMLSLVEDSSEDITWITSQLGMARNPGHSLVEFPGILLPSFQPTLQALQQMSRTLDLPFSELLVRSGEDTEDVDIPAPAYSRRPNFSFNLETLVRGDRLRLRPGQPFDYAALRTKSTLDDAQQFSTVYALGRCLALIQGPPGTGKSYTGVALIKALLRNREIAELGPVICVCYTNHALDQLLEHLVEDGVTQLIRLGSRSKSEILQNLDLHHVSMEVKPTRPEGQEKYKLFTRLDTVLDEIDELMSSIKNPSHSSTIKEYLEAYHYGHYQQLFSRATDDHGYQEVRGKKFSVLNSWLKGASKRIVSARAVPELLEANLLEMSSVERLALYKYWIQQSATEANIRLLHSLESYHEIRDLLKRCHQETDLRCLLGAHVIGVTTTGLARNLDVLRRVRAKVIMFEEAGEILEAHTLTALLPSVEHAILIGDHEQLRPQVNNYEFQQENLRGKNPLDISLFERLVRPQPGYPKLPFSSLEVQRRMHPSIAELVRATLYPQLIDHSSVFAYPEVDGMRKRLFWLDHDEKEDSLSSDLAQSFSKTNTWEVEMVAALVTHLVRQGVYRNEDIAVLTPYLGQLQKLKQRLRSSFAIVVGDRDVEELEMKGLEGDSEEETPLAQGNVRKTTLLNALRVATVDNFQGEEAKVIIVSLVRCNDERKCGFLKTSNRINVLLSRARHGMYIIGSTQTARPVPIWNKVITILEEGENIGRTLALRCPRHKETPIEVSKADDFSIFSPEGGCNERCISRLGCGHACINKCHSQPLHESVRCLERCHRGKKGCDHSCPKVCGDPCDKKCKVPMADIALTCGHIQAQLPCHLPQAPERVSCPVIVEAVVPACKHKVKVRCYELPLASDYACKATCNAFLRCGHNCKGVCSSCNNKDPDGRILESNHGVCKALCGRQYTTCSHKCSEACHEDKPCPLCVEPCEVRCSHSKCGKKCHEPCMPCIESCSWSCPHRGACKLPCAVPCDLLPCSMRCSLMLDCGHQCPSICGETCPDIQYCQKCADKSIKERMVDYIMRSTYAEIDLDNNPCIIPSCGHLLTRESMDGHMDMMQYYITSNDENAEESIIAVKTDSVPFSSSDLKNCPLCRIPLRNINRYGRIVRRAWIDEATKKFIVWANSQFVPLASKMEQAEAKLQIPVLDKKTPLLAGQAQLSSSLNKLSLESIRLIGSRDEQLKVIRKADRPEGRYRDVFLLRSAIAKFRKVVDEAEQPISHIYDLIEDARRHRGVETKVADLPSVLQVRHRLLATVLLLRCDYAILRDFVNHSVGAASAGRTADFSLSLARNREDCEALIQDSRARQQPAHELEGLLYWVRFTALERGRSASLSETDMSALIDRAHEQLGLAHNLCKEYPGQTAGMPAEISAAERMVRGDTFYAPVTNAEKAAVYAAMTQEFSGTGHWYNCVNGHPFTVGECGMPMQTARCPQCGAAVGGNHHQPVAGVTRATDMDEFGH